MFKRLMAMIIMTVLLVSTCSTAFAAADVKDFAFTMKASEASSGYYPSTEYARKYDASKQYASIRVNKWSAIPTKNIHTGIVGPGMAVYTTFAWMTPPATVSTSVRVFSKYNSTAVSYTGNSYKHYAAMRLNTDETVATVKVSGVFTPDSK